MGRISERESKIYRSVVKGMTATRVGEIYGLAPKEVTEKVHRVHRLLTGARTTLKTMRANKAEFIKMVKGVEKREE